MPEVKPTDLKAWIILTNWEYVESTPVYRLARDLAQRVQDAWDTISDRPRFHPWYDQASRSSLSILNNWCEAIGRGRGHFLNYSTIARGEVFETLSSLALAPEPLRSELFDLAKQLQAELDRAILELGYDA